VGIGYETPWRQVKALLIPAARCTPGVRSNPLPFVLQTALEDFAVRYEINAYTDRAHDMPSVYADLNGRILDPFNEHGVQIMTPAYEGDPEQPKLVARELCSSRPRPARARDSQIAISGARTHGSRRTQLVSSNHFARSSVRPPLFSRLAR
jgi:small-conductance mechanosensitive channel